MNGTDDNTRWRVSDAEFRGYVKGKLESISGSMADIKQVNHEQEGRITNNEKELSGLKVKMGILGSVGGFIGGFIGALLKGKIL